MPLCLVPIHIRTQYFTTFFFLSVNHLLECNVYLVLKNVAILIHFFLKLFLSRLLNIYFKFINLNAQCNDYLQIWTQIDWFSLNPYSHLILSILLDPLQFYLSLLLYLLVLFGLANRTYWVLPPISKKSLDSSPLLLFLLNPLFIQFSLHLQAGFQAS